MIDDVDIRVRFDTARDSFDALAEKLAREVAGGQVLTPMTVGLAELVLEQKRTVERLRRAHITAVAG